MNIINRIKNIEAITGITEIYCRCSAQIRTESYLQYSKDSEPELITNNVPEVCPTCSKPIETQKIIVQFFDERKKTGIKKEINTTV